MSIPSSPYCFTHVAILFTVLAASVPAVVGVLVEPKAETMSFIPAVLYSDLIFCLVALSS